MPVDANGMTTRARALTAAIRKLLDNSGISGREISQRLGFSHGIVSHWVTGRRLPSPEDMASLLTLLRVTGDEKQRLIDLARHAAEPNWLVVGMPGIPHQLAAAIESERSASTITEWARDVIPGLLQTAEYARALANALHLPPHEIDKRVMLRVGRAEVITRRDPVNMLAFVAEDAIYEQVGSAEVMADQLRHLVALTARTNVTLQLVPPRIGWHPGWAGPFVLYDFPDAPSVVHLEHYSSGAFVLEEDDVLAYRSAVEMIRKVARSPADSAERLVKAAEELEQST